MPDQITELQDVFKRGLRSTDEVGRNVEQLVGCNNLRATRFGLARHSPIINLFAYGELVQNGDFTNAASVWTLGSGWAYDSGKVTHTSGTATLSQSGATLVTGLHKVTFTTSGRSAGSVTPKVGAASGVAVITNAIQTQYINSSGFGVSLSFTPTTDFDGSIDVVSLTKMAQDTVDWVTNGGFTTDTGWNKGAGWTVDAGDSNEAAHAAGSQSDLDQDIANLVQARVYRLTVYVSDEAEPGTITPKLDGVSASAIAAGQTGTGFYSRDIIVTDTPGDGKLIFTASSDSTASLDNVILKIINPTLSWPFPQIFHGDKADILADEQYIYTADLATEVLTLITLYDAHDQSTPITDNALTSGAEPWQFVDMQQSWFLISNNNVVFKIPSNDSNNVMVTGGDASIDTKFTAMAQLRNRLFFGGFSGATYFASTAWTNIFTLWKQNTSQEVYTDESTAIGTNWIMWSTPSGGDYDIPFVMEMAMFQIPTAAIQTTLLPHIRADIKNGDIGFLEMPWQGAIHAMKGLGDAVIVYGAGGVSAVVPSNDGFTVVDLMRVGVSNRAAVGGDDRHHLFVDNLGDAWMIGADLQLQKLEYREFISPNINSDLVISYDAQRDEFYICQDGSGYILSNGALSEINQVPTSLIFYNGILKGVADKDQQDSFFQITSDSFDFGFKDIKTIHSIEIGATDISDIEVAVQYKYTNSTTFTTDTYYAANDEGIVTPIISGTEFRIIIRGHAGSAARIDYTRIRWRATVKRAVSGLTGL